MRTCPACNAELAEADLRCPGCGHLLANAERLRVIFKSRQSLRRQLEACLVHRGLLLPRAQSFAPDTAVQLVLVLPEDEGEVPLMARVVGVVEKPARANAPYDVQLELLDLDPAKEEILRRVAGAAEAAPAAAPVAPPRAPPGQQSLDTALGSTELDALLDELLRPCEPPSRLEQNAEVAAVAEPQPVYGREKLPEEVAQHLTDFTLHLVQAVTKSSYYTAEHREAEKAKGGLYASFSELVTERPEVTFHAHTTAEKRAMLVYGVFDEPTDLSRAMLKGMAEIYIPKLSHYFESKGLVSISFKRALDESEFHRFVDLLASPAGKGAGAGDRMIQKLAESRIHHISLVVQEDRLAGRHLSWRVEMTLTRLKKDLSVIPLYEHLSEAELQRIRLEVFRDVIRPLRQVNLIRELLENCDLVVAEVEGLSAENLAEMESQILSSVTKEALPALLEGLVEDIVEAKRAGGERMDQLLRLTRRVAQQLTQAQVEDLENAFRVLLEKGMLSRHELPAFVQQKLRIEHNRDVFLTIQDELLQCFDAEPSCEKYRKYLQLFETIFPELLAPTNIPAAARILEHASSHRDAPAPFEARSDLAEAWFPHLVASSLGGALVERLPKTDKVEREALLDLARGVGEAVAPVLFTLLRECESVSCRQDLARALVDLKHQSLHYLNQEFVDPNLPSDYLCELLGILAQVGSLDSEPLVSGFRRHADARVRVAALNVAETLALPECERWAIDALGDRDRVVQEASLKLLFDRRSTAPELFGYCGRILSHLDESLEGMARRICAALCGYDRGEHRKRSVALLLAVLADGPAKGGGLWSSLRRSLADDSGCIPVKIAACHALGRLRANEASEVLERLGEAKHAALKQAARHALDQIERPGESLNP